MAAATEWPLHWAVWHDHLGALRSSLADAASKESVERRDPRGRTPLLLAVALGRAACARLLLEHGADANCENSGYWSAAHEATARGDPELLQLVLQHRDYQRAARTSAAVRRLLRQLQTTPDFFVEMSWQFNSWVPLISRMCPSDTCKIFKRGGAVRIDTTLTGFDSANQWTRGNVSFIFRFVEGAPQLVVVDHQRRSVSIEEMGLSEDGRLADFQPSEADIDARLSQPVATTYIDVERIGFERSKSGFFGWRSERVETVGLHPCKVAVERRRLWVFDASNVELVTKTRNEHLTAADKSSAGANGAHPVESLLRLVPGSATTHVGADDAAAADDDSAPSADNYFNSFVALERDVGRPKSVVRRSNSFKATLWLCDDFPLSLPDQIMPIIDLMAVSNAHFNRLKEFIEMQLPAGFPVKVEIPLFHVITAQITFGNAMAAERAVDLVTSCQPVAAADDDDDEAAAAVGGCLVDATALDLPADYTLRRSSHDTGGIGGAQSAERQEDMYLQFAIEQSLLEQGGDVDESVVDGDADLQRAIAQSARDEDERRRRLLEDDEEQLRRALELSKVDM